ncbi:hypothetical protein BH09BAC3_BH09BAC3_37830 [soil metagenome]
MIKSQLVPSVHNRTLGFILILCFSLSSNAQSADSVRALPYEISLTIDNDILFLTDQYYTAGQNLNYRFQKKSPVRFFNNNDSSKTIIDFQYGFKVFNPKNLDTDVTAFMDRPYCGWQQISASLLNFRTERAGNFFKLQLGLVGPMTGIDIFQQWWHKALNLYPVEGWDSQISNELVVNFNYNHTHEFPIVKGLEIVSSSGTWIGTGSNRISQEVILRLFNFNPLAESAFMNATLSREKRPKQECFVFISFEGDYVFSNIFIQGSLFKNNPSQFVTSINPWLLTRKIGIQYSEKKVTLGLTFVHLGKETEFVSTHDYTTIVIARRF